MKPDKYCLSDNCIDKFYILKNKVKQLEKENERLKRLLDISKDVIKMNIETNKAFLENVFAKNVKS
jgi:hypothetical protein